MPPKKIDEFAYIQIKNILHAGKKSYLQQSQKTKDKKKKQNWTNWRKCLRFRSEAKV